MSEWGNRLLFISMEEKMELAMKTFDYASAGYSIDTQ